MHGLDLSTNMVGIAQDYRREMEPAVKHRVQFYVEDGTAMDYPDGFYDVVYSRDAIMHIAEKEALYRKLIGTLKPGGKLMVSSYLRGDKVQPIRALGRILTVPIGRNIPRCSQITWPRGATSCGHGSSIQRCSTKSASQRSYKRYFTRRISCGRRWWLPTRPPS